MRLASVVMLGLMCCGQSHRADGRQVHGTPRMTGIVRDATGATLMGVSVSVTGPALPTARLVVTDATGRFEVDGLPPDSYRVTATLEGFEPRVLELTLGEDSADLEMVLDVAAFSDRVSVTATKAGPTDIQSTPTAVTSLPDRTLEALQVEKIEALAGFVPTLTVSEGPTGSPLLTIRGIGSNSGVAGVEPSSTFHLDGVYAGRPAMVSVGLMDVERIEVLRGPQGTLYGRNSVGGTVNIVSRQPTNTLATRGRVLAGADDKLRVEGAVSGPLAANRLMGRFAFLRGSHDGYVKDLEHPDNPLGSEDTWAARGQMRVVLGRRNELLLSADYGRFDGTPLPYAKAIQARPGFDIDIPASLWLVRASHEASGDVTQKGTTARVNAQLTDTISMMSLTAYRKSDSRISIDPDGTELPIVIGGGAGFRAADLRGTEHRRSCPEAHLAGRLVLLRRARRWTGRDHAIGPGVQMRPFSIVDTWAWALFGQATYGITGRVSLTAGVRYSDEQKDTHNTGGTYRLGTDVLAAPGSFYDFVESVTYHAWTPRVSAQLRISRDTFLYGSAARGFKSGGLNVTASRTRQRVLARVRLDV